MFTPYFYDALKRGEELIKNGVNSEDQKRYEQLCKENKEWYQKNGYNKSYPDQEEFGKLYNKIHNSPVAAVSRITRKETGSCGCMVISGFGALMGNTTYSLEDREALLAYAMMYKSHEVYNIYQAAVDKAAGYRPALEALEKFGADFLAAYPNTMSCYGGWVTYIVGWPGRAGLKSHPNDHDHTTKDLLPLRKYSPNHGKGKSELKAAAKKAA
jgi:hypothetical protein